MSACQIHQSCSGGGEKLKYFRGLLAWHRQCFPLTPIGCSFKLCYVLITQVFLRLNLFFEFFWSHTSSVSATEKGHYGEVSAELAFLIGLGDVTACSPGMLLIEFQFCFYAYKDFFLFVLNLNILSLSLYNKHGKHYKDYSLLWDSSCPSNPELDRRLRKWMEGGLVASFLAM